VTSNMQTYIWTAVNISWVRIYMEAVGMKDDIFAVSGTKIFKNRSILSTKYLPERLIARDQQIQDLANLVKPVLSHGEPRNAMVYGKTGTGKTVVVRYVLKKLHDIVEKDNLNVKSVFINCKEINTTTRIILEILDNIAPENIIVRTGLSTGEYYNFLWEVINKKSVTVIIVFDEIDQLKDHNILYNLSRAGENIHLKDSVFIGVIGLSNDLFFTDKMESRIVSSLGRRDFVFPPYDADQISQILEDRSIAFEDNVLEEGVVSLCAAYSAQENGDARKALMLLEIAGEVAERENALKVTEKHVLQAYEELNTDCIVELVKTLPLQSKLVLLSIVQLSKQVNGKMTTGKVESMYQNLCAKISTRTLGRTSVSKLISELDMLGIIEAPVQNRGRYGKTRLILIDKYIGKIENALFTEPGFVCLQ
jgi:cell division control protein 6